MKIEDSAAVASELLSSIPYPLSSVLSVVGGPSPALSGGEGSVVVIGYGNALRGDDAVGLHVAAAVDEWELPDVRALAVHQLTPELAEPLAAADVAIFVDACQTVETESVVHVRAIRPERTRPSQTHAGSPGALLAFAGTIYGHAPQAWWITVPAQNFAFGSDLSPLTRQGQAVALRWIRYLLRRLRSDQCTRLD